jgi:hypothetical protein
MDRSADETCLKCGERPEADDRRSGGMCRVCHPVLEAEEPVEDTSEPEPEPAESTDPKEPALDDGERGGVGISLDAAPSVEIGVDPDMGDFDSWMPWADWGRKQPNAEGYSDAEDSYSYSTPVNWTDYETARKWADMDPRLAGYGFVLQREGDAYADEADPHCVIDFDDARDPKTGRMHPIARDLIERAGSYADASHSWTGGHIIAIGTLPDGVKSINAELPHSDEFPDASIEVYDGKRFVAMTGRHIETTPEEPREIQDLLDELAEEYATVSEAVPDEIASEPEITRAEVDGIETTTDSQVIYDAIQHTKPHDIRLQSTVTEERADGSKSLDPHWETSESGARLAQVGDGWVYRKGMRGLDALQVVALEERIIHHEGDYPSGEDFGKAVDALRQRGAHIPEYEREDQHIPEQTDAPNVETEPFDVEEHRKKLRNERYQAYLDTTGPHVWRDSAGAGKSVNAELAADARDREYFIAFDKHLKAHESRADDVTSDDKLHLKGSEQPKHDCCLATQAAIDETDAGTPECPEHGRPEDWPRMCPVYDLPDDNEIKQRYAALVEVFGPKRTHLKMGLFDEDKHPWHGQRPAWAEQFDWITDDEGRPLEQRVAGVHEYQLLESAKKGRDVIVDESPRSLATDQRATVEDLFHASVRLEKLAEVHETGEDDAQSARLVANLNALAAFAENVAKALSGEEPATFDDIAAPDIEPATFNQTVDPDNLPADVDPEDVEDRSWREYQGVNNEHYIEHQRYAVPTEVYDEPLAKVKLEYNEGLVSKILDEETDIPFATFCIDTLLAAASKAGVDDSAVRRAIAIPPTLDACPWCGGGLVHENGARVCAADNGDCDWDERDNSITQQNGEQARARVWTDDDPDDLGEHERPGIIYGELPSPDDLPDSPLVLDATATKEKIAGVYNTRTTDITVTGDTPLDLDGKLHLTQIVGGRHGRGEEERYHAGGQYHKQTILDTESIQERIQNTIDTVCDVHESPLFGIQKDLISLFDWPDNANVLHYGGARGLNRGECDAVCCIGAPHPNIEDLERQAELLAIDNPDLEVGGEEYSTRRDSPNPPEYRTLLYEDENGDGLEVPTKAFSGLVGALFKEAREKELEQFIHRIRPLLVDDEDPMKHGYLLTDVPTDLPVDEVAGFEELADPLEALFPVPERGVELLRCARDAFDGNGPDGFRVDRLIERRDDGTVANKAKGWHALAKANGMDVRLATIYNWLNALEGTGLLVPEKYEQRRGVSYTADIPTLKSALLVLSGNGGLKVAAVRRLAAKIRESDGALGWLDWAKSAFGLGGDRCQWEPLSEHGVGGPGGSP